ncbi:translation elongation factor-like protein [Candidatus Woesearchaeota archaeon]|nr:translation elongation factor-like protein [Candidatus Woesearchaeota archaeon]
MEKKEVGKVAHFFSEIGVAAIRLTATLKVGDKISIEGATTNFQQTLESMQINRQPVKTANSGDEIGIKAKDRARGGDIVYKLEEESQKAELPKNLAPKKASPKPVSKKKF